MAGNPALFIRVAGTIEDLKRSLAEGKNEITAAGQQMIASTVALQGRLAIAEAAARQAGSAQLALANDIAKAGNATQAQLTEMSRLSAQYLAMKGAVGSIKDEIGALTQATTAAHGPTNNLRGAMGQFDSILASLGVNIGPQVRALGELGDASGKSASQLGAIGVAGLAVGAGVASWGITRAIMEFFELDQAVANAWSRLLGFGDVAAETAAAKADVLAKASANAGRAITDLGEAMQINANAAALTARGFDTAENRIQLFHEAIAKLRSSGDFEAFTKDLQSQVYTHDELVKKYGITSQAIEFYIREQKQAAEADKEAANAQHAANERILKDFAAETAALKPFRDAMVELNSVGVGWKGTLDTIDGTVVEAIKFYLQAGVSQKALAEAYQLTDAQVKAIASSLREETESQQRAAQATADHAAAAQRAADALDREAEASNRAKQQAEEKAAAERKIAEEKKALNRAMGNTLDIGHAVAADPALAELLHMGWSLENAEQILLSRKFGFTPKLFSPKGMPETTPDPSERVPGYASGVINAPGGWARVGERGPELMYVPPRADIYPSGSGAGAGAPTIQIYITQPLGTPTAIAKAVDDALMRRQRAIGTRF